MKQTSGQPTKQITEQITDKEIGQSIDQTTKQTAELVLRVQNGEAEATEQLYMRSKNKAYYLAFNLLKNTQDAEDVLQDSYITAFTKLNTLDNPEKFQGWLDTIVINRAKDVLKKKKPMVFAELKEADGKDYEPQVEEERIEFLPQENLDYQETKRLIQEIIDKLPEEQRIAVMLYYYESMSVTEIADYFDCAPGTIKSRLNYARKAIKSKVEELEKKGTKLYCAPVLPFLYWMFRMEAEASVYASESLLQEIQQSVVSSNSIKEALEVSVDSIDSVEKAAATKGIKGVVAKVSGLSFGIKVGMLAAIVSVSTIGGILYYKTYASRLETKSTLITEELNTTEETLENQNEIIKEPTPTQEPMLTQEPSPTQELSPTQEPLPTQEPSPAVGQIEENASMETIVNAFEGIWNRTNVYRADGGTIEITNSHAEGFDFYITVAHGGNTGEAEGNASIENKTDAIAYINLYDDFNATFYFTITEDKLEITTKDADMLGGAGTFFNGTYIQGEPTYSNENIEEETLDSSSEAVRNLLGENYEVLTFVMEEGTEYITNLTYSGFISGIGEGADLWVKEDGNIYCLIYEASSGYRFYTNDAEYQKKVPEEFGQLRDSEIEFIFVKPNS